MEDGECRNWLDLPPELTSSILHRLGTIEILKTAQRVCRSWRALCREPSMWQKIDMTNTRGIARDLEIMCRHAIDRSQGGLVDINIEFFGCDDLLQYIADSSSNLRRLRFAADYHIEDKVLAEASMKLPLLEDLEVTVCSIRGESLKVIAQSCPNLKTLKLNYWHSPIEWDEPIECDEDAQAIAENMPGLRHLQLFRNGITNTGLNAILDKCLHLEHLDLRQCSNIKFVGDLEKRCSERIKVVRRPYDLTPDFGYDFLDINHLLHFEDHSDFYSFDIYDYLI